jgi:hypothetical protein
MHMASCTRGEKRNEYRVLVGKAERERQLGRHEHGWEDNIRMDVRVTG